MCRRIHVYLTRLDSEWHWYTCVMVSIIFHFSQSTFSPRSRNGIPCSRIKLLIKCTNLTQKERHYGALYRERTFENVRLSLDFSWLSLSTSHKAFVISNPKNGIWQNWHWPSLVGKVVFRLLWPTTIILACDSEAHSDYYSSRAMLSDTPRFGDVSVEMQGSFSLHVLELMLEC